MSWMAGRSLSVVTLMLMLALCVACAHTAQADVVTVVGRAVISGDATAAEKAAVEDALRKAVEQSAGVLLQAATHIKDAQVLKDEFIASSRGYITKYNVVSGGPSSDGRTYLVTVEADVNTQNMRSKIKSQEEMFAIRNKQMENKNVLVLGIKQFHEDLPWATKTFELAVQMVKDKLNQAQFVVLDEGAISNYAGVAANIKKGTWRKPALYQAAKAAGADWMVVVAMDATKQKADPDHAFNSVEVAMRMELIDVNQATVLTTKYEKASKNLNTTNPAYADWREAAVDAGRNAAELEITDVVNTMMDHHRAYAPTEPQRYIVEFDRFQDQHVDAIVGDIKAMNGCTSSRVKSQNGRNTVVQVYYEGTVDSLRTGLKKILAGYGYNNPRISFQGNTIKFSNTTRF